MTERPKETNRQDPYEITQMPDKETLEDFLRGMGGRLMVIYNSELGIFQRVRKPEEKEKPIK